MRRLTKKARCAIRARMTPEMIAREDNAKMVILNDFRQKHGLSILTAEEAGLVEVT